jgi:hypothetical protein
MLLLRGDLFWPWLWCWGWEVADDEVRGRFGCALGTGAWMAGLEAARCGLARKREAGMVGKE